jgi:poly(A) polymerase
MYAPLDERLTRCLERQRQWESDASAERRRLALATLGLAVSAWVESKLGAPAPDAATVLVFGSCRMLGEVDAETDVDCVLVTTSRIARSDFFASFVPTLASHADVTNLNAVPTAFVPIVKFELCNVHFDLLHSGLPQPSLGGVNFLSDQCLVGMDDASVRSLNGSRVAEIVLQLVPDVSAFRSALRAVRLWAKRRGVYSNVLGYLGGINCAILVAKVAQIHPRAASAELVTRFFELYSQFDWECGWVELCAARRPQHAELRHHAIWGERPSDAAHTMPIITPAFPAMNSAYNVAKGSLAAIQREARRGAEIVARVEKGELAWSTLFEPTDFFSIYNRFLRVRVSASSEEAHQRWFGWAETRLRGFVRELEATPRVETVRLLTTPFPEECGGVDRVGGDEARSRTRVQRDGRSDVGGAVSAGGAAGEAAAAAAAAAAPAGAGAGGERSTSFFIGYAPKRTRKGGPAQGTLDMSRAWSTFASQIAAWGDRDASMDLELQAFARADVPMRYKLGLRRDWIRAAVSADRIAEPAPAPAPALVPAAARVPPPSRSASRGVLQACPPLSLRALVSCNLCTVTFHANHAHNLTRSP